MPPIAAAFAAIGGAMGAAAGTASVLAGVSAVGAGLSVVGKITGSKTLSKLGGVMSLVGGVGSLVNSAIGAASGAAGAAGATEGVASLGETAGGWVSAEGGIGYAGGMAADTASSLAGASEALTSGLGEIAADQVAAEAATPLSEFGGVDPSFTGQGNGLLNAAPMNQGLQSASQLADETFTEGGNYQGGAQQGLDNQFLKSDFGYGAAPPSDTSSTGIKKWWDAQPEKVKSAIIQGGLGAVGGMFDGWSAQQKLALEREKMNLISRNANAQPVVAFKPVTKPTGLLNAQRTA